MSKQYRFDVSQLIEVRHNNVCIMPFPAKDKSPSGMIILPEQAQRPPMEGIVISVGPGKVIDQGPHAGMFVPCQYEPGDHVAYGKYGGNNIVRTDPDGTKREFVIIPDDQIICKFPQYDDEFFANTEEVEADEEGEEDLTGSLPERGRTEYLL